MPARHSGRECECELKVLNVARGDLIEAAVARACVIFCGTDPLAVIRLKLALVRMRLIVLLSLGLQHGVLRSSVRKFGTASDENDA